MKHSLNTDVIRLWTEPATVQSNNELYPRVASGCAVARQHMILSNIGLLLSEADRFLAFVPECKHLRDDLISDAFVGLVEAVNRMSTGGPVSNPNPTGFMSINIRGCFGKTIEREHTIRIPRRSRKRNEQKGLVVKTFVQDYSHTLESALMGGNDEDEFDNDTAQSEDSYDSDEFAQTFVYDDRSMQDLRETLDACCETDAERTIIRMREQNYVDREIAEVLGLPLTTTYVLRRTIYARFLELTGWKGEA